MIFLKMIKCERLGMICLDSIMDTSVQTEGFGTRCINWGMTTQYGWGKGFSCRQEGDCSQGNLTESGAGKESVDWTWLADWSWLSEEGKGWERGEDRVQVKETKREGPRKEDKGCKQERTCLKWQGYVGIRSNGRQILNLERSMVRGEVRRAEKSHWCWVSLEASICFGMPIVAADTHLSLLTDKEMVPLVEGNGHQNI